MRWWLTASVAIVCLVAVPAASAKELKKVVAVGANGNQRVIEGLAWNALRPAQWSEHAAEPTGEFVLIYPVMERGVPAQPGRFYPAEHTVCYSWDRAAVGECFPATSKLESALTNLSPLTAPPAILKRIVVSGRLGSVQTNAGVAIELAFNRADVARKVPKRPKHCFTIRATWIGPDAADRPSRFWACGKGLWAAGKLYPTGPLPF